MTMSEASAEIAERLYRKARPDALERKCMEFRGVAFLLRMKKPHDLFHTRPPAFGVCL